MLQRVNDDSNAYSNSLCRISPKVRVKAVCMAKILSK